MRAASVQGNFDRRLGVAVTILLAADLGCVADVYSCNLDGDCIGEGQGARCEATGRCSLPDAGCPTSRRYGDRAGYRAGECVPPDELGGTEGEGESSSSDESGSTSEGSSDGGSTSTGAASTSSEDTGGAATSGSSEESSGTGGEGSTSGETGDDEGEPGVAYEVYVGMFMAVPDFSTLTPDDMGVAPNFDVGVAGLADGFALRFTGQVELPMDGDYVFYLASDDGSRLAIDGNEVVDNDGLHAVDPEVSGMATLTAGRHDIEVTYFELDGEEVLTVSYEGPGIAKTPIPDAALFHLP